MLALIGGASWLAAAPPLVAQQAPPAQDPPSAAAEEAADPEVARQQQIVERFVTVLERNPRRGTALDRIYGHHIENGTLDDLVKRFTDRTEKDPKDGTAWMILGLIEAQRGRDAAAVTALERAKDLRPTDAMPSFYLGQSLILVGQPDKAVAAFEEAIARKPVQADLMGIYQALGRVHQQAQHVEQALEVWARLEKQFPGDLRVQEDIAATLVEEGQYAEALPRYEALAKAAKDDYRQTMFHLQAADLKIKTNHSAEGIADLEALQKTLNPQNWLFREVRHHIEEVYLRSSDDDGLAKYYQGWLEKNPEDIDAMARLARVLARQARVPEAQQWLDKALRLAPSRKELRVAFIDQLVDEQRYADAIAQYVELDKVDPNNPDYLRNWGKLILRDTSRPKAERQAEAEKVWRRMVTARPNDPLLAAQVADLFRYAEMPDASLAMYQKAVELAPTAPQYREYLGEYYHILKRPEDAQATWRKLAEGPQRTAANVARLAEVYAQFGYLELALPEIAEACTLDPKDYPLQLKAADFQIRGGKHDDALASLQRAEKLAQNDEEHEAVLVQQIKVYTLEDRLAALIEALNATAAGGKATARDWYLLARYQESLRAYPEATAAITKAVELAPQDLPSLATAARIAEQAGQLEQAVIEYRKLAVADRRGRTEHLRHVAELEAQIGRVDEALAAGRDLIAAAPGNVDMHQFFADLCFRLGQPEEALKTLRRAVRANPADQNILLALASALASQFRSDEAIELYWQAFDKAPGMDDRLSVIGKLTDLYMQTNHFDRLLERLERNRQEAEARREMTICLAQAYQSSGDFGAARQELERLLNENSRDTQLLTQLSKLAEAEADLTAAASFQEQVVKIAPGPETEYRLATLLSRAGRSQEAAEILVRLAAKEEDREKLLRNIDGLLSAQESETVLAAIEPKLRENPLDWELIYREGVALAERRPAEAATRFQALLKLELSDDEQGTVLKARAKSRQKQVATGSQSATARATSELQNLARTERAYEIQRAVGINSDVYYSNSNTRPQVWTPQMYGQARMAALGWLYRFAQKDGASEAMLSQYRDPAEKADAKVRALWDWAYLESVRGSNQHQELLPIARRLALADDIAGHYLHLQQLQTRNNQAMAALRGGRQTKDTTEPLKAEDLDLAVKSLDAVERFTSGLDLSNMFYMRTYLTQSVLSELRRAGRTEQAQEIYARSLARAKTAIEHAMFMQLAIAQNDRQALLESFDRFAKQDLLDQGKKAASTQPYMRGQAGQVMAMALAQQDTTQADALAILDRYLNHQAAVANLRRKNSRPSTRPTTRNSQPNYVRVLGAGGVQRNVVIQFPSPNQYFDSGDITLLRSVYEWFKQKDLSSDLAKHVDERIKAAGSPDKIYNVLALGYLHAWAEDTTAALKSLTAATDLEPQQIDLRLDLAQYCLQSQQLEEALVQLDAVTPVDQNALRDREMLALDVAVRLGDLDRSRQAAQRLFGLRIDAETQIQLAGKMRRLGMNAEAEAIMARAQRHAGSSLNALAALLGQYLSEGRTAQANEVAHQILRRSRTLSSGQQAMGYNTADSQYRTAALQCLSQSGQLKEIIARVEAQLARSPESTQLAETLAEYYQAAGNNAKSMELQGKIVELHPEDSDLRFRYAQLLMNANKAGDACEQYKQAIKRKPALLQNRSYDVLRAFQQAKREGDLAEFVGTLELKGITNPWGVMDLIRNLFQNREHRAAGLALMKKAWEAFPAQRSQLVQGFYDDTMWKVPEIFEFGRQSLLPAPEAIRGTPWAGLDVVMSFSQDGRVNTVVEKVLSAAASNNQLDKLREDIAAHLAKNETWSAGKVLLALVDLRRKQPVDMPDVLKPLIDAPSDDYRSVYARWIVGQEIDSRPELRELAVALYKSAQEGRNQIGNQFQYSPGVRLVKLYLQTGRREEARKVLVAAATERNDERYDPQYAIYQRAQTLEGVGKLLVDNNFQVDALRVYRELLTDPSFNDSGLQNYGRNIEEFRKQAQGHLDSILAKMTSDAAGASVIELLAPRVGVEAADSAIDLLLSATPAGQDLPKIESMVARFLSSEKLPPDTAAALGAKLEEVAAARPQDFSVAVAQALVALRAGDPARADSVLGRVKKLVDDAPLETLAEGTKANARQRAEALRQVGLWLIARACLATAERRELGAQLADRAVEAAARQLDPSLAVAMLHERGLVSIEAKNRADAERDWTQLLELAVIKPRAQSARRAPVEAAPGVAAPPVVGAAAVAPRPPAPPSRAARGAEALPVTLSQFQIGSALAQLAVRHDMAALSLRAVREILSGGLPVADLQTNANPARTAAAVVRIRPGQQAVRNDVDQKIYEEMAGRMWQTSNLWQQHGLPAADVCGVLERLVFPASRPNEVLLFEQPPGDDWWAPKSLGRLLATWAERAGRVGEIEKQVAARQLNPADQLGGHVLLTQVYLAAGDVEKTRAELQHIRTLVDSGKLSAWADTAAHAVGPAFADPRLAADAAPVLAKVLSITKPRTTRYEAPRGDAPVTRLIRYFIRQGKFDEAKAQVDAYLASRTADYARYGGDSVLAIQRLDLTWAANELCWTNKTDVILPALAKLADTPATTRQSAPSISRAMTLLARQLAKLPPAERYTVLRDWSLPTTDRRSVRLLVSIENGQPVPNVFLSEGAVPYNPRPRFGPISNLGLLVDAAREAGKLEELNKTVEPLVKDKVPGADTLGVLLAIAGNDPALAKRKINELVNRFRRDVVINAAKTANDWSPIVVAHAAVTNGGTVDAGQTLLDLLADHLRNDRTMNLGPWLAYAAAEPSLSAAGETQGPPVDARNLKYWITASGSRAADGLRPPVVWAASEGTVKRICGSDIDQLVFRYPLTGDFELTAEVMAGRVPAANFTYGGIGFLPIASNQLYVQTLAGNDMVWRGMPRRSVTIGGGPQQWHRASLRMSDGKFRFAINGYPVFEDSASPPTSPWVGIFATASQQPSIRNLALHGTPKIPREVRLVDGNHLEGWAAGLGSTMPPSASLVAAQVDGQVAASGASESRAAMQAATNAYDWSAADGALSGRHSADALSNAKGWLYYHRPLQAGETVRYQFLHQPGESVVHPTIGRVAQLLEPDGVRLLWLDAPAGSSGAGLVSLDPDATVTDPAAQRTAPGKLLKVGEWNDLEITLVDGQVTTRLNGEPVCQRPLDSPEESYVGFFYRRGESGAQVRQVVLTGNWPESLDAEVLADLLAPAEPTTNRVILQARQRLVGEGVLADNIGEIWSAAGALTPAERYERFEHWVLPSDQHASYRLQSGATDDGRWVSPALELGKLAKELGKLDDLAAALASAAKEYPADTRAIAALETLVAVARGDDATANDRLSNLTRKLKVNVQEDREKWPHAELFAAEAGLSRAELRTAASALAEELAGVSSTKQLDRTDWQRRANRLVALGRMPAVAADTPAPWALAEWKPVDHLSGAARALAYSPSVWTSDGGEVRYFTSKNQDGLYFALPLRGDFEVRFEQEKSKRRGLSLMYGGLRFTLSDDGKAVNRYEIGRPSSSSSFKEKLTEKDWNEYRIEVKGGTLTATVNGVTIGSEKLPADPDAWLALQTSERNFVGRLRGVRITGQPSVPGEIPLSGDRSLSGWQADYFGQSYAPDAVSRDSNGSGDDPDHEAWSRRGEEIVGALLPFARGSSLESLLQYHRPLADGSVLDYEFYWDPDKTICHPAIGGTAYLLEPSGIKLHQLTAGALDRSGIKPDNAEPLLGAKPIELKTREWNQVRLSLKGDKLTISVNGHEVGEHALDPAAQRTFGLFHYRDLTDARARNVVLRGQWPTAIPAVDKQELAGGE